LATMSAMVATGLPVDFYMPLPGDPALTQQSWQYYVPDGWNGVPYSSQSHHSRQNHQNQQCHEVREDDLAGDGYDYAPAELARIGQDLAQLIDKLQGQLAVDRQRLRAIHRANANVGRMVGSPKHQPLEKHGSTSAAAFSKEDFGNDQTLCAPSSQELNDTLPSSYNEKQYVEDRLHVPKNMPKSSWTTLGEWHQQIPSFYNRTSGSPVRRRPGRHAKKNILFGASRDEQEQTPADVGKEQKRTTTERSANEPPEGSKDAGLVEIVKGDESAALQEKASGEQLVKPIEDFPNAQPDRDDMKEHLDSVEQTVNVCEAKALDEVPTPIPEPSGEGQPGEGLLTPVSIDLPEELDRLKDCAQGSNSEGQQSDGKAKEPPDVSGNEQSDAKVDDQPSCATIEGGMDLGSFSQESGLIHQKSDRCSWADVKDDEADLASAHTDADLEAA